LLVIAAVMALGGCAGSDGAPAGASNEEARVSVNRGGSCDPAAAPPRRAAVIAYDGAGQQRWSVPLPVGSQLDSNVGPLVDGDTVYSTEGDELRSLDAGDGSQRWRLALGGSVYDASVRDGVVVVRVGPLDAGHVLGVEAATGRELWRFTPPRGAWLSWQQLPTDDGGVVVTGERGALVVLERRDGTVRWSRPAGERATPRVFAVAGDRVLWIDRGALESLDAATGELLWRAEGVVRPGEFSAELTITGDVVIVALGVDPAYRPVTAYDLATGQERWRLRPSAEAAVVGAGPAGVAVVTSTARQRWGSLELVHAATGTVRWSQPLTGWIQQDMVDAVNRQALVTADEVVYVEQFSNLVVSRSARDGSQRWRTRLPGGTGRPQWTATGRLLMTAESFLVSVDTASGRVSWQSRLPRNSDRPAAPLGDGAVIQVADPQRACTDDGRVSRPQTAED
jgi:outer membrane protein assembly factor BamB